MSVRVNVHERAIQSLFLPGGQINTYGRRNLSASITRRVRVFAADHARTGELLRSFRTSSRVRHNGVEFTVYSTAPQALFLERGTRGQVGPHVLYQGETAPTPRAARWQEFVGAVIHNPAGTRAYRFMEKALAAALTEHRLV